MIPEFPMSPAAQLESSKSTAALRILVVDDDELDRLAVRRCLQRSSVLVRVDEAASVAETRERIAASRYDCILLDYYIPGVEGLALLRDIRETAPDTPVVILTGRGDEEVAVELMKSGAADYLPKASLSPERLAASLRFALELFEARAARRRAEAALHEQREWLRVTLSSIGDGVIATDTGGVVAFLNPVAQALTGWTLEEAEGQPLTKVFCIVNEQTRASVDNPALRAMEAGSIVGLANHTILIAKDGTERPIDDSGAPIRDTDGKVIGAVLIFRDITERRQLEREKDEQTAAARLLAAVVESSEDAIISHSLDGIIQTWNVAAEKLFDCTAEQAVGQPMAKFIPADRLDEEHRIRARVRSGERITDFDTERVRADGRLISVGLTISPIRDERGGIVGMSRIARDITTRKRAEALVRLLSEAAQHLLTAGEPDALVRGLFEKIKGPLGVDAYVNYAVNEAGDGLRLESSAGISKEAVRAIRSLDFGTAVCGTAAAQRRAINATHIQQSDEPMTQLVKSLGFRAYVCHPLLADYRLLGTLCFASLSKDEFSPEELGFLRTVSHYVTAAYERLRHIGQLREGDRRKDEFLATLAHELRGPLAPICNVLELMKQGDDESDVVRQARETIERQVSHMVHLVDDLLDVSRITRDKLELRREDVLLASVVDQAVEVARPLVDCSSHKLTIELPPEPIFLHADPVRLVQALGNLLTNACKYTNRGGRIRLSAERQESDVLIRISDTGIGIPPDQLASVFEIFSQVDSARDRSQGGLGIGLTLVKRLVEMHGGWIKAHSEGPGHGSEFVVRLPIRISETQLEPATPPEVKPAKMTGQRILIVDDNRDSAQSLALLLRMNGNTTSTAHNGLDAVEAVQQFQPEVVLMDIGLPGLNGYEACRRIREQSPGRKILMIAMTGWGQDDDRRQSKEAGFDHHLVKPVNYAALIRLLAERT